MKKLLVASLLFTAFTLCAQERPLLQPGRVIFYNVENLFDTINDPDTQDEEFLPSSKNQWNSEKYNVKIKHIAHVIGSLLDTIQPLAIGLAEVENRKVLEDLIAQPELKKFKWGIAHHDSPDERGIDVAILYNKDLIEESFDAFLKVALPDSDQTRDILYLKGYVNEGEPLWIFVNHWPSRRGGKDESSAKRMIAEKTLKDKIENLYLGEKFARVVVMGDFNDNPVDSSVTSLTKGKTILPEEELVELMLPIYKSGKYTLKYKDENDVFDQFIVSKNLLNNSSPYFIRGGKANIYSPEWILFKHPKYGMVPNRTYASGKWVGGYSDHLPVYFDIVFK